MARYIDADELIAGRVANDPVRIAALCAETADVVPVRRGEWKKPWDGAGGLFCSLCGRMKRFEDETYCAGCGALNKREGEE